MFGKNKRRKQAIGMAVLQLTQNVRYDLKAIQKQIEVNLPPSTYIHTVNYLRDKVEEIIDILAKEW
jgi:hypothetical protein